MRKVFLSTIIFISTVLPYTVVAAEYTPLVPDARIGNIQLDTTSKDLGSFLDSVFQFGIAIAIILAVIMVIIGGLEYMTSESPFGKGDGKERISAAIGGLILALSTILIFNEINPNIANTSLSILDLSSEGITDTKNNYKVTVLVKDNLTEVPETLTDDSGATVQGENFYNKEGLQTIADEYGQVRVADNVGSTGKNLLAIAKVAADKGVVTYNIPDTNSGSLACAAVVSHFASAVSGENLYTLSTSQLVSNLRNSPSFEQVSTACAGCIIVSPSKGNVYGHAGIIENSHVYPGQVSIISNSTSNKKIARNYNLQSWFNYFQGTKGLDVLYFRPK